MVTKSNYTYLTIFARVSFQNNHGTLSTAGNYDDDDDDDGVPRCTEHGERCVKLRSNSEKNPGREFFKCSRPKDGGDQCDFFQWLDGEVGGSSSRVRDCPCVR